MLVHSLFVEPGVNPVGHDVIKPSRVQTQMEFLAVRFPDVLVVIIQGYVKDTPFEAWRNHTSPQFGWSWAERVRGRDLRRIALEGPCEAREFYLLPLEQRNSARGQYFLDVSLNAHPANHDLDSVKWVFVTELDDGDWLQEDVGWDEFFESLNGSRCKQ